MLEEQLEASAELRQPPVVETLLQMRVLRTSAQEARLWALQERAVSVSAERRVFQVWPPPEVRRDALLQALADAVFLFAE